MDKTSILGGCRCGKVRFEASVEKIRTAVCACIDCQKASGSPLSLSIAVKEENFRFTQGEDVLKSYPDTGESGKSVNRFFCTECGSPLIAKPEGYAGMITIRVLSLDNPPDAPPSFAIFTKNIPEWITIPEKAIKAGKKFGG
ncbi:MAG: hypothetical protein COB53_10000 [Elusimicrobia bacterium]|nr:MAG: hypothetical protein COB53_10000 [Elusimicrobiota bacterium]